MAKKQNELSANELETLACDLCGWTNPKNPNARGLKRHKTTNDCWPSDSEEPTEEVTEETVEVPAEVAPEFKEAPSEVPITAIPPVVAPPVEEPPMLPSVIPRDLGIKEITVGSIVHLTGEYCKLAAEGTGAVEMDAEGNPTILNLVDIPCVTRSNFVDPVGRRFLTADALDSSISVVFLEEIILDSKDMLKKLYKPVPVAPVVEAPVVKAGPTPEEIAAKQEFFKAVSTYFVSNEAKKAAEKSHSKTDAEMRETILDYLQAHGAETSEGSGDSLFKEEGYEVLYSYTEGQPFVNRDEEKIIEYLKSNFPFCLKPVIDFDMWEQLKSSDLIPAEFIREVEIPDQRKPDRRLYVKFDSSK